ncbi:hypothetical protein EI94DRAFT_1712787 [Lactarius quietus]|nr:hypothetical protein EI94DRAFT_1712787 [Lactarius quietus]
MVPTRYPQLLAASKVPDCRTLYEQILRRVDAHVLRVVGELDHPVFHLDVAQFRWRTQYEKLFRRRTAVFSTDNCLCARQPTVCVASPEHLQDRDSSLLVRRAPKRPCRSRRPVCPFRRSPTHTWQLPLLRLQRVRSHTNSACTLQGVRGGFGWTTKGSTHMTQSNSSLRVSVRETCLGTLCAF